MNRDHPTLQKNICIRMAWAIKNASLRELYHKGCLSCVCFQLNLNRDEIVEGMLYVLPLINSKRSYGIRRRKVIRLIRTFVGIRTDRIPYTYVKQRYLVAEARKSPATMHGSVDVVRPKVPITRRWRKEAAFILQSVFKHGSRKVFVASARNPAQVILVAWWPFRKSRRDVQLRNIIKRGLCLPVLWKGAKCRWASVRSSPIWIEVIKNGILISTYNKRSTRIPMRLRRIRRKLSGVYETYESERREARIISCRRNLTEESS